VIAPPETRDRKSTWSINRVVEFLERNLMRSNSARTPYEKAAARMPPPENASPTKSSSSSPDSPGSFSIRLLTDVGNGWLVGSTWNVAQPASAIAHKTAYNFLSANPRGLSKQCSFQSLTVRRHKLILADIPHRNDSMLLEFAEAKWAGFRAL